MPVPKKKPANDTASTITNEEIDQHNLLDDEQRKIAKALRNQARKDQRDFTMLDFARIALKATSRDLGELEPEDGARYVMACRDHERAALLFAHEAMRAAPPPLTVAFKDEVLFAIALLSRDLPA